MADSLASRSELEEAGSTTNEPVHIVNFDIKDNPESATIGAVQILELCQKVRRSSCMLQLRHTYIHT